MLITKVMHYLLINGSSLFWAKRWYEQVDDRCGGQKKVIPVNGGKQVCMENALLGSGGICAGGGWEGSKDSRGEERRKQERRGGNKKGEEGRG